ncbi:transcriptional activator hap3 [Coemansia sp. RSA 989]|nr:histone-fold-containing protein [Coemansia mojavensis]KAJ1741203.1 transcriptional activator hap3 [Coemansia sp. RSA 1086]KAJ1749438.1 transcriptional activator hap3 [Coemansia sp. RSA 1821]KAJ1863483.1 transcriptional activator hap3 [Coemansia sp. RSA 989]KAJ1871382.1 transcriptional activator hap3 [Coemansia sp. RSA 990]KAJ2647635.1 transcriptional activator hap3 [Coemansia sp. RSA 1250]KAJ2669571.1 transcriptional activator hap3 [Coemansia sp. RSA 1085]
MSTNEHQAHDDYEDIKEQDRFLPIANVARIMKRALPENAKIAKEAKETVQECVSEFISFITSEASDRCQQEKRKTINGEDILWAMQSLGFESYAEVLKVYLNKYRESVKVEKDGSYKEDPNEQPASPSLAAITAAHMAGSADQMNLASDHPNIQAYMNSHGQNSYYGPGL